MRRKAYLLGRSFFKNGLLKAAFPSKTYCNFQDPFREKPKGLSLRPGGGASLDIKCFFRVADVQLRGFLQWGETANF